MAKMECIICEKSAKKLKGAKTSLVSVKGKLYCQDCLNKLRKEMREKQEEKRKEKEKEP